MHAVRVAFILLTTAFLLTTGLVLWRPAVSADPAFEARLLALEELLQPLTRVDDTLVLDGVNLQIVNGEGRTTSINGVGNLIVGYNEPPDSEDGRGRLGSHGVVIGGEHEWHGWSFLAQGTGHTVGPGACAIGGEDNRASARSSCAVGGEHNQARAHYATAVGGQRNFNGGPWSVVIAGRDNMIGIESDTFCCAGYYAYLAGGFHNEVTGYIASTVGGYDNETSGVLATNVGNIKTTLTDQHDCQACGSECQAVGGRAMCKAVSTCEDVAVCQ